MTDTIKPKKRPVKCTTCAEQCANNQGGRPFNSGCLCNDGEFIKCKKRKKVGDK